MAKLRNRALAAAAGMMGLGVGLLPAMLVAQPAAAPNPAAPADIGANPQDNDSSSAYIRPPEPPLPDLPPPPSLPATAYPDCREDYQQGTTPLERARRLNVCTNAIDGYYRDILLPLRQAMIRYQTEISNLYTNAVVPNPAFLPASKDGFYARMMEQHRQSNPDGANLAGYRAAEARYQVDRTYLQDRFCFNTGCGGYPAPVTVAASPSKQRDPEKSQAAAAEPARSTDNHRAAAAAAAPEHAAGGCGKARKRGSAVGGFLGGVAGGLGGLGRAGTMLASGFSGLLVGEIACKLSQEEQVKAAEATVAVTRKEEVGATAAWQSPTRSGVSGSSTVTALNAEPNGRRCLNITDVAIIDGEETRVAKRMCRGRGDAGYVIQA